MTVQHSRRHDGTPWPVVPSRYLPVLRLLALGLPNKQIAARSGLADGTVRNYISQLIAIFGVANRTQLAIEAEHYLAA
ncbi:MAG: response regulator transcription factor [Chloroflexi bacterium]|nr:response regulator transcription factor [Chloroflexota bacterium]